MTQTALPSLLTEFPNSDILIKPKQKAFMVQSFLRFTAVLALIACVSLGYGQTVIIAGQDFESSPASPAWSYTNSGGATSTTNTGTPANRIRNGSRSFQISNTTGTLTFDSISVSAYTSVKVVVRISSVSVTSGNGIDASDYFRVFTSLNGAAYASNSEANSDITVKGGTNCRWSYNATGTSTNSGTNTVVTATGGTDQGTVYSTLTVNIPNGTNKVGLRIVASNNDGNEVWCIDDVEINGVSASGPKITASAGTNGSISPSGTVNVTSGNNQSFTITPDACYNIADVLVDGASVGAVSTYQFTNVTSDHTIAASFSIKGPYAITASAGANGTISPAGSTNVTCGANQAYTITPNSGYAVNDVLVDGASVGAVTSYTFTNVTAPHTISVSFKAVYNLVASAGANGSISPSGTTQVNSGANQTYIITPATCYQVSDVLVDGASVGAVSSYTFTNVTANHTIAASFAIKGPYAITASAGANGSISPSGTTNVTCGANQAYTITANSGYAVSDVLVDGVSVGAVTSYTFTNVTAPRTISVTFAVYVAPKIVISQVYGGGGNSGAPYKNDFIELFNAGTTSVSLNGWSVQYAGNSGSTWTASSLPNTSLGAGKYFLIQLAGGSTGASLPTPDHTDGGINMGSTGGKVALVSSTSSLSGSCPTSTNIQDFVGFGSANCSEGSNPTAAPSNSTWVTRDDNGCTDTDNNGDDFSTTSSVTPRNTASPVNTCATQFTITTTAGTGGSISPTTLQVNSGANQTFTITPNACYNISDVKVDGVSQGAIGTYTFTNVTAAHTIEATFAIKGPYAITASAGANGAISPAGSTSVTCGANQAYTFTPNSGYAVSDVIVDGVSQGALGSYTFTNVTTTHTISVSFVAVVYSITTSTTIPTFVCPGSTFSVPFTINYPATSGNVFKVELSNAAGSFASPSTIGTLSGTASGTVTATMPTTANGNGYRVRVVSTNPAVTGSNNGSNIASQFNNAAPVFTESMGSVSSTATMNSHETANGFDNDAFTMSGTGEIRSNTNNSTGYQDASGNAHVYLAANSSNFFRINGISTATLTPLALNFAVCKSTTGDNGSSLLVEVSGDGGTNWTTVNWGTLPTGSNTGDGNWTLVKVAGIVPTSSTVSVRFTNNSSTVYYRLDDVAVYTGTSTTASITPSSPATQCGGSVVLNALPAGGTYLWSNTTTNSSVAATSSGSYSVTVTDRFACSATAGPVNVSITTPSTPSVTISNSNATACTGSANTFTATPVNGGTPSYQWKVNGSPVGTNSATYSPAANTLNNGDVVTVEMTATGCVSPSTVTSNPITLQKFAYGPLTTVWTEDFGTSTASTITGYSSASNPTFTFTGSGNPIPDLRTSTASPGGGANVYMGASGFDYRIWTISGINTTNAFPNKLSFYIYNPLTSALTSPDFILEVSTDGTNFIQVNYGSVPAGQGWKQVSIDNALPKSSTVWLRFSSQLQGNINVRFDDIKLEKYTTGDAAITPAGPTTLCSPATQVLTATATPGTTPSGFTYLWGNAATTSTVTASTAGTYSVTLTDVFGCQSSASTLVTVNTPTTWYQDSDNDGYGNPAVTQSACTQPVGYVANNTDCAPADGTKWQSATLYIDNDNDSYTNGTAVVCYGATIPAGYKASSISGDCNDNDNTVWQDFLLYIDSDNDNYDNGTALVCFGASIPAGYKASTLGTDCNDNNPALTTACGTVNTWLGNTIQWSSPGNWSFGYAPSTCADNALIPSAPVGGNYPTIGLISPTVGNIEIQNGARITANNVLKVCGNITGGTNALNSPVILGTSYVELVGTSQQTLSGLLQLQTLRLNNAAGAVITNATGNLFDVFFALELQSGELNTGTNRLRFRSISETESAVLDNFSSGFSGTLTGTIQAERYYGAPSANSYNQHFMSSPLNSTPLTQFGANGTAGYIINTACDETQSNSNSPYGSVFEYDETHGTNCGFEAWKVLTGGNAVNGKGYSVAKTGAGTLTVTGTPNTSASYSVTGITNSNWTNTTVQSRTLQSGWNLVGNPYLAELNLQTPFGTGIGSQVQIWNTVTGQFDAYVVGVDPVVPIAPFQAFYVRKVFAGAPSTAVVNGSNRSRNVGTTFYQQNNPEELTVFAQNNQTGLMDNTRVRFTVDATNQFDEQLDANKLYGKLTNHTLYTLSGAEHMSRNNLHSIAETSTVPLSMEAGTNGTYTFTFDGLQSFDPTSYITLEDVATGTFTDIRQVSSYTFTMNKGDNADRFVLHFTPAAKTTTTNATCEASGMLNIEQPGTANWNYTVTNGANAIATGVLNQTSPVTLSVAAGNYTVTLVDNNNYTVVKTITVNGNNGATVVLQTSAQAVEEMENITFAANATNATDYTWNFGDGTIVTNQTAAMQYQYNAPGVYTVSVIADNGSCNAIATQTVTVNKTATAIGNLTQNGLQIYSYRNRVVVDFGKEAKNATIAIFNLLGQELSNEKTAAKVYTHDVNNLEAGYVIVKVLKGETVTTQKVFITNK